LYGIRFTFWAKAAHGTGSAFCPLPHMHGITLTRADQVVWWGPVSSTEIYLQANSRAHRAGQTNKVTVTHLQGSPVERRMYTMLQNKIDLHQSLVDLYKQEIE